MQAQSKKSPTSISDQVSKAKLYQKPLQEVLCNLFSTRLKSQVYHWNAHGPQFYGLHKLLEEVYKNLDQSIDDVAERSRTMGIHTISSFEEIIQFCGSQNKKSDKFLDMNAMIEDMNRSFDNLAEVITSILEQEDLSCKVTEDLLIKVLGHVEKFAWMLRSFEKKESDLTGARAR